MSKYQKIDKIDGIYIFQNYKKPLRTKIYDLEKENEVLRNNIVKFIEELAWNDAEYDAFQSTMGDMPASRSAVPRYAKKYFDLWKEMFGENIQQAKEQRDED